MLTFSQPLYLLLLSFVPIGIFFKYRRNTAGSRFPYAFSVYKGDCFSGLGWKIKFPLAAAELFYWLSVTLLIAALSGPAIIRHHRLHLNRGIDIMIVLDESPSMSSRDFAPDNRFGAAKEVIRKFISSRENDPVGLVVFSQDAALKVPPTLDYDYFLNRVEDLQMMSLGKGTAIGMGISVASLHLRNSSASRKVIILLTDGDNNAGEILPESAADIAAKLGIKIYAIGIGTEGDVPGEYMDPDTGKILTGTFRSDIDEDMLDEITSMTGGRYFAASTPGALETVFRAIDSLEAVEKRVKIQTTSVSLHTAVIIASFVLFFLYYLIRKILFREVL